MLPAIPKAFQKLQNKSCNNNERENKSLAAFEIAVSDEVIDIFVGNNCDFACRLSVSFFIGVMGEYEPKIEVQFPEIVQVAKGSTVRLECFALGK